ncbi:MAG TPA: hypothetical protein VLA24_10265 [Pseudomonadales bacterium]|nr:hypothetical protein [Pseudomonadales bacterium]
MNDNTRDQFMVTDSEGQTTFNLSERQLSAGLIGVAHELSRHNADEHTIFNALLDLGLNDLISSANGQTIEEKITHVTLNLGELVEIWVPHHERPLVRHSLLGAVRQLMSK